MRAVKVQSGESVRQVNNKPEADSPNLRPQPFLHSSYSTLDTIREVTLQNKVNPLSVS